MDVYFEDRKVQRTESCLSSAMIMIVSTIRLRLVRFGAPREGLSYDLAASLQLLDNGQGWKN
jgi:hypothetical protein